MNDELIITSYVVIDDVMRSLNHRSHPLAKVSDAEVLTVAVVAGSYHDLTPLHELTFLLPAGACVFGDKGYNSAPDEATILAETGVRVIPIRRKNMAQHEWVDEVDLKRYRKGIETVNSQLEKMGAQQLHARTNTGFEVKVHASLFALACSNIN
jgi:IS5 family transposase